VSQAVREMFDRISGRYDLLNHALSVRRDISWRRTAVAMLPPREQRVLDLCGGTGDFLLAARAARVAAADSRVADFSRGMMLPLPSKGLPSGIQADALRMPFKDGSFDAVLCGYGMRNFDDPAQGAREILRVLRPGGTFVTLEFFRPGTVVARFFYGLVAPLMIPAAGTVFGSSREAYEYLVRSIRGFLPVEGYAELLRETGFSDARVRSLDFGLCHAVAAQKP
jgi:demethylmenaquinone methyltransferase / 2-methoxy-6-polyprenyl-1,4-benzoquinol methylase